MRKDQERAGTEADVTRSMSVFFSHFRPFEISRFVLPAPFVHRLRGGPGDTGRSLIAFSVPVIFSRMDIAGYARRGRTGAFRPCREQTANPRTENNTWPSATVAG